MLMDLDAWRRQRLTRVLEEWVNLTQGMEGDQSALNLVFNGLKGIHLLDWRWNLHPHMYHELGFINVPQACLDEAKVFHFSGRCKPWTSESNWDEDDFNDHA